MKLKTDTCDVCKRERPELAISVNKNGMKYCNDNHNDLQCHLKAWEDEKNG